VISGGNYEYFGATFTHTLLFDDAAVSGVSLTRFHELLAGRGGRVVSHVLIEVLVSDLTGEEQLNGGLVSPQQPDYLVEIINDPRTVFVVRTVKNFLRAQGDDVRRLAHNLLPSRAIELYEHALANGMNSRDAEAPGLSVLREVLCDRGLREEVESLESTVC
jgi:hypothetical protein